MGKLYTSILVDRVRGKVENILDEFQGGFRLLRGCQDQIFCMRQTIEKLFEKKVAHILPISSITCCLPTSDDLNIFCQCFHDDIAADSKG